MAGNTNGDFNDGIERNRAVVKDGAGFGSAPTYITITTGVNILEATSTGGTPASQAALDKLVEIVSLRGQPIILGVPVANTGAATGTPAVGGAGTYTVRLMNEHQGSWEHAADVTGVFGLPNGQSLAATIAQAGVNYGFGSDASLFVSFSTSL